MQNCIQVSHLVKKYKQFTAVDDISFQVPQGSVFAFLGPNGAGKSTSMNILSTLMKATSGRISIQDLSYSKDGKEIKNQIGYVFQENHLDEQCSVYQNLMIRGSLYPFSKKILSQKIQTLAKELNFTHYLNIPYGHCSGGQKRIVSIARALIHNPQLIILDEPTTGLDPNMRKMVWDQLLNYQRNFKITLFFSSHYLEEAMIAHQVCILNKGKIVLNDTPASLIKHYGQKRLTMLIHGESIQMEVADAKEALKILNLKQRNLSEFECLNSTLEDIFLKATNASNSTLCQS